MSHVFVWDLNLVITVPVDGRPPAGTVYMYIWDLNLNSTVPADGIIPNDFKPSAGVVMTTNLMYMYGTQIWSPLCLEPSGARPLPGTVMTTKLDKSSYISVGNIFPAGDCIQNGRGDLRKCHGTLNDNSASPKAKTVVFKQMSLETCDYFVL